MPHPMGYFVQSVVVQGKVYVGGGDGSMNSSILMVYDISSREWATLPSYGTCYFAMAVINNQLALVGGWGGRSARVVLSARH